MSTRGQGASTDPMHLCVQEHQCHFQSRDVRGGALCCSCLGSYSLAFSVSLFVSHCFPDAWGLALCLSISLSLQHPPCLSAGLCRAHAHPLSADGLPQVGHLSASALAALSLTV